MQAKIRSNTTVKSAAGAVVLAFAAALILWQAGALHLQWATLLDNSLNSGGRLAAFGLVSLRAFQAAAFDHAAVGWFVCRLLVLFSAFGVAVAGLALLRSNGATR